MWNRYCRIVQDAAASPPRQPGPSLRRGVEVWATCQAVRAGTRRRPQELKEFTITGGARRAYDGFSPTFWLARHRLYGQLWMAPGASRGWPRAR